jgi:hemoglobin
MVDIDVMGGEPALRRVIEAFYDRIFSDVMIGFMFRGRDKQRLVDLETQLTARVMGGQGVYEGRSMRAAHAHLRINRGQYLRRNQILRETLRDLDVPEDVQTAWLSHAVALERAILGGRPDPECQPIAPDISDP